MKNSECWFYVRLFGFLGIILASYLLYSFLFHPTIQPCSINASFNCDAVTKGPISTLFNIPVSLYGLIGYICILIFSFTKNKKLLLGVATFGMLFCLRLTFIEIFMIKVICPVCLVCQLDMLLVFLISIKLLVNKQKEGANE